MSDTYVAFDVETPNHRNDRMSAIGVVLIEDGAQTRHFYSLVDPECEFDAFNIRLTGITPWMVRRQPTFPVLWERLRPLLEKGVLCAHNAVFDLGVLGRCLQDYGIEWKPAADYVCTCQIGQRLLPDAPNHRLNTLADRLGIQLQHHNALSDTRACASLLQYYAARADLSAFEKKYDFTLARTRGISTQTGEMEEKKE